MQALTAQGASCQNYILVRGLLALPPCAFIEDDARGLLLLVGGASVGLQEASAWKSPMRFTAAAGGLAAQKVAPGMSPRYPTSAARLPECAVGPGELVPDWTLRLSCFWLPADTYAITPGYQDCRAALASSCGLRRHQ